VLAAAAAVLAASMDPAVRSRKLEDLFYFHQRVPLLLSSNLDCLTGRGDNSDDDNSDD